MKVFEKENKKLCSKDIAVDEQYQRRIKKSELSNIVKHFDQNIVHYPRVSFRDGKYYVFDGQHTIAALEARNGNKHVTVECEVFYGMTQMDEQYYFKQQTGYSSKPTMTDKLRGDYKLGDKVVKQMVSAIESTGLEIKFDGVQGANRIVCTSAIWKAFNSIELPQFVDMLTVIKNAWGGTPDSLCNQIIGGMAKFYKAYYGEFDAKGLTKKLHGFEPIVIVREAKGMGGGNATVARIILRIYNSGRTTNRLADKL